MTIYTDGLLREPAVQGISELPISTGQYLYESGASALEDSPVAQFGRMLALNRARGQEGAGDAEGIYVPRDAASQPPQVPIEEARARVKAAGLDRQMDKLGDQPIAEPVLDLMMEHARGRAYREAQLARGGKDWTSYLMGGAASFLAGALDPVNIGASFIPIVGEARAAKWLADAGQAFGPRLAVRAGIGAAQGAAGMVPLEGLTWLEHSQEGQDYTAAELMRGLAFGGALGGVMHGAGGAVGDLLRKRAGQPLYPFAVGEPHDEQRTALEGAERDLAAMHPFDRAAAELSDLPPEARAAALRATAGSLADGRTVQTAEMLHAAAETDPRVAESIGPAKPALTPEMKAALADRGVTPAQAEALSPAQVYEVLDWAKQQDETPDSGAPGRAQPGVGAEKEALADSFATLAREPLPEHAAEAVDASRAAEVLPQPPSVDSAPVAAAKRAIEAHTVVQRQKREAQAADVARGQREAAAAAEKTRLAVRIKGDLAAAGRPKDEAEQVAGAAAARYVTRADRLDRPGEAEQLAYGGEQPVEIKAGAEEGPSASGEASAFEQRAAGEGTAAPWYHSAVLRAVEGAKQAKANAAQWLGTLKNLPGVKPEEMQWLGLEDWLKAQKGPVTKDAIADYVRAHQVDVREVVHGEEPPELRQAVTDAQREYDVAMAELETASDARHAEARRQRPPMTGHPASDLEKVTGHARAFEKSDHPVAVAYRAAREREAEAQRKLDEAESRLEVSKRTKFGPGSGPGAPLLGGENYRELLLTLPKEQFEKEIPGSGGQAPFAHEFNASHWNEPNVLAHVRFDDRVIDGKRTLHMAEIQSDWHQKGRKGGYGGDGVPDAPFKATSDWATLALKRMIRYASENGYDRISWDSGATNAERYDLSKQVSKVEWVKAGDSGFTPLNDIEARHEGYSPRGTLGAWDHQGNQVISKPMQEKDLPDAIGKEAADKLLAREPRHDRRGGIATSERSLEGLDLKVGGEGMEGFYDKILPAAANKLVKKYGAKVGEAYLPGVDEPVHTLGLTPELRRAAIEQGFPLFQRPAGAGAEGPPQGRVTFAENKRLIELFKSANASTAMHEFSHVWLQEMLDDAARGDAPMQLRNDRDIILKWFGVDKAADVTREHHELWARTFERYLRDGQAPSLGLRRAFEHFTRWLSEIYKTVRGLGVPVSDEMRGVFDRMLATDREIEAKRAYDQAENARPRRAVDENNLSLHQFLAHRGGLQETSDLRAILGGKDYVPGFGRLIRKGGMTEDRAREAASEAGYLHHNQERTGEQASIRDLHAAIREEAHGGKVFRAGYEAEGAGRIDRDEERFRAESETMHAFETEGVPLPNRALLDATVDIVQREGLHDSADILDAFERAAMEDHRVGRDQEHERPSTAPPAALRALAHDTEGTPGHGGAAAGDGAERSAVDGPGAGARVSGGDHRAATGGGDRDGAGTGTGRGGTDDQGAADRAGVAGQRSSGKLPEDNLHREAGEGARGAPLPKGGGGGEPPRPLSIATQAAVEADNESAYLFDRASQLLADKDPEMTFGTGPDGAPRRLPLSRALEEAKAEADARREMIRRAAACEAGKV